MFVSCFLLSSSLIIFHVHSRTYQLWSLNPVQQRSAQTIVRRSSKTIFIFIFCLHTAARPSLLSEVGIKNRKIFIGDTCFYLRQQISSSAESIDFILISVVHARVREVWNLTIVNSFSFLLCCWLATIHWSARSYWRGFCSGFNARSAHAVYFEREKKSERERRK